MADPAKVIRNQDGANQHKPCPPDEVIRPFLTEYWGMGRSDVEIQRLMLSHYDHKKYGLSVKTIKRRREKWGLLSTRQANLTLEEVMPYITEIRSRFPEKGADGIKKSLLLTYKVRFSRQKITQYLKDTEPDEVRHRRKLARFTRKRYYSAGVNDVWAQDQHDKWGIKFGLWFHCSLDPFTGWINWLQVWWTNSNPRLITKYYLDACRKLKAVPVLTQSDPGTENNGVANAHTTIRHSLDPTLTDTLQHQYMKDKQNIKPEINWSILRKTWSPGFEDALDYGIVNHLYNPSHTLQNLVFRWLAIPWIQAELDNWVHERNFSCVRSDPNKVLPHGVPAIIRSNPGYYDALDFKIMVPDELLDDMENLYAPPTHPVFELTPALFEDLANSYYNLIGSPEVNSTSFWAVYSALLAQFESRVDASTGGFDSILDAARRASATILHDHVDILPNLKPFTRLAEGTTTRNKTTVEADFTDSDSNHSDSENHTQAILEEPTIEAVMTTSELV